MSEILKEITFKVSLVAFYLKGRVAVSQNFLSIYCTHTILGFIPWGGVREELPVHQIAKVEQHSGVNFKKLIGGILLCLTGYMFIKDVVHENGVNINGIVAGFIMFLIFCLPGLLMILTAPYSDLVVRDTSGDAVLISFLFFDHTKRSQVNKLIKGIIGTRLNDTNVRQVGEAQTETMIESSNAQTQAIVDAIKGAK